MSMGVPALGVRERQPADESGELAIAARPDDEMPVIRHEAVGQEASFGPLDGLQQDVLKGFVIGGRVKDREPGIGAIQHMVHIAAEGGSEGSSHALTVWDCDSKIKNRFLTPLLRPA